MLYGFRLCLVLLLLCERIIVRLKERGLCLLMVIGRLYDVYSYIFELLLCCRQLVVVSVLL